MFAVLIASLFLFGAGIAENVEETPTVEVSDIGDEGYFTKEWRKEYDEDKIANQPKWKLTKDQPEGGAYEIRQYAPAWWVTSYTPCYNQTIAAQMGYLRIYIYLNKYNKLHAEYKPTYPILHKVEIAAVRPDPEGKEKRVSCPDRFSVHVFLPHPVGDDDHFNEPAEGIDESIMTSEDTVSRRRFVKRYDDFFTAEMHDECNYQAGLLATSLALDGRRFNPDTYYCALYERGRSGNHGFEVWFDEIPSQQ